MSDFGGACNEKDAGLNELLLGCGIAVPHVFTSLRNFKAICTRASERLIETKDIPQYLAFIHVKKAIADQIDRHLEDHRGLPHMTILFDSGAELLILKLMFGVGHGVATGMFRRILEEKVGDQAVHRHQLIPLGSSSFGLPSSSRSKSADEAFKPKTRRLENDWPSVVIEVGALESLCGLQSDARFWLTESGGRTHIVLIAAINNATKEILIQRWEDVPGTSPELGSVYNPSMTQRITLEANVPGTDVSEESKHEGYTHCFIATFESAEARVDYLEHPTHVPFANELRAAAEKIIIVPFTTTVALKASC